MAQLYTNEQVTLEKTIQITDDHCKNCKEYDLDFLFEYEEVARWVKEKNLQKICLQFPDYMLPNSAMITSEIQKLLENESRVYILGDSSYESCCVDYISAAHIDADGIVHFGNTCFSKSTNTLPTLFIYEKAKLNLDKFFKAFFYVFNMTDKVHLILDTPYSYMKERLLLINELNPNINVRSISKDYECSDDKVLYVGAPDRKLVLFKILSEPSKLYYYNNSNPDLVEEFTLDNRILKRHTFLIETVKDSATVGIIVGTVAIHNYKTIVHRIMKLCKIHKKKYYLISVGKVNVAKLANYPELDVYVLIGCAMNEVYESRDFYKPIVTPYDVELALNPQNNNVNLYDLSNLPLNNDDLDNIEIDGSDVSLISGKIRVQNVSMDIERDQDSQLVEKSDGRLVVQNSHGASFLNSRSWKGLEQNLGETKVELASEGRTGLAQNYNTEPNQ